MSAGEVIRLLSGWVMLGATASIGLTCLRCPFARGRHIAAVGISVILTSALVNWINSSCFRPIEPTPILTSRLLASLWIQFSALVAVPLGVVIFGIGFIRIALASPDEAKLHQRRPKVDADQSPC